MKDGSNHLCILLWAFIFPPAYTSGFYPFLPNGILLNALDRSISNRMVVWLGLLSPCFKEIPVFMSDLGF